MNDQQETVSGLSDAQAAAHLESLGYNHYRVRSVLVEARQSASVTLERHLITLMSDGFRIETLARQEDADPETRAIPPEQDTEPERERSHYEGDDCDPPHVILPPGLSAEHAELLAGMATAKIPAGQVPLTPDQARQFLVDVGGPGLGYTWQEANNAVTGAMAAEDGVYRLLDTHDVAYIIEPGPGGKHLGYVITAKGEPSVPFGTPSQQDQAPPRDWPAGMHEAHCGPQSERDDRCGPHGEMCGCPCHRGEPVPPLASGLTGDQAVETLVTLGCDREQANRAVADAMLDGISNLPRDHAVWYSVLWQNVTQRGVFAISTKVPVPGRKGHFQAGPPRPPAGWTIASPLPPGLAAELAADLAPGEAKTVLKISEPAPDDIRTVLAGPAVFLGRPLRHQGALNALIDLGYPPSDAMDALQAAETETGDGVLLLARHILAYDGKTWTITDRAEPDPLAGIRQYDRGLEDDVSAVLGVLEVVDAHLDDAGPQWAKDCPEANMYRRVGKAQLEAAEAMEELSLLTGENPRKGRHPEARDRMLAELGDTAVAALLGIQSQVKDTSQTWAVFLRAVGKARDRVPANSGRPDNSEGQEG
jgi:hypothetical protein